MTWRELSIRAYHGEDGALRVGHTGLCDGRTGGHGALGQRRHDGHTCGDDFPNLAGDALE
jgi:hypothetical protein